MDFEKPRSQNTSILREYKKVHAELKKLKEGMNSQKYDRFLFRFNLYDRLIPHLEDRWSIKDPKGFKSKINLSEDNLS